LSRDVAAVQQAIGGSTKVPLHTEPYRRDARRGALDHSRSLASAMAAITAALFAAHDE